MRWELNTRASGLECTYVSRWVNTSNKLSIHVWQKRSGLRCSADCHVLFTFQLSGMACLHCSADCHVLFTFQLSGIVCLHCSADCHVLFTFQLSGMVCFHCSADWHVLFTFQLSGMPCEFVINFDAQYPVILGGLLSGEDNTGFLQVWLMFVTFTKQNTDRPIDRKEGGQTGKWTDSKSVYQT